MGVLCSPGVCGRVHFAVDGSGPTTAVGALRIFDSYKEERPGIFP